LGYALLILANQPTHSLGNQAVYHAMSLPEIFIETFSLHSPDFNLKSIESGKPFSFFKGINSGLL